MSEKGRIDCYRYGYQGQEKDDEIKGAGNSVNYTYRMHDTRLGRFFAVDPLAAEYPWNSVYAFSENRVIDGIELEGLEWEYYGELIAKSVEGALNKVKAAAELSHDTWVQFDNFMKSLPDPNVRGNAYYSDEREHTNQGGIHYSSDNISYGPAIGSSSDDVEVSNDVFPGAGGGRIKGRLSSRYGALKKGTSVKLNYTQGQSTARKANKLNEEGFNEPENKGEIQDNNANRQGVLRYVTPKPTAIPSGYKFDHRGTGIIGTDGTEYAYDMYWNETTKESTHKYFMKTNDGLIEITKESFNENALGIKDENEN